MKSRILKTLAAVTAMVLCVGMTVFAAPSNEVTGAVTDVTGGEVGIKEPGSEYADIIKEVMTEEKLKELLGDDFNANMTILDIKEVYATGDAKFPAELTFTVDGVTSSTNGFILVWDGTSWTKIAVKAGETILTGTFNSEGIFVFVADKTTLASGTATSPQTSASAASMAALVGLTSAAAAFGLKRKER